MGNKEIINSFRPCDFAKEHRLPSETFDAVLPTFLKLPSILKNKLKVEVKLRSISQESLNRFKKGLPSNHTHIPFRHEKSGLKALLAHDALPPTTEFYSTILDALHGPFSIDQGRASEPFEGCLTARYLLQTNESASTLAFAFPFETIHAWLKSNKQVPLHKPAESTRIEIDTIRIPLRAVLGRATSTKKLEVGDIISLQTKVNQPIEVCSSDQTIFYARPGITGRHNGILL